MSARNFSAAAAPATPRFDRQFIEEHGLIERYLLGQLPARGARDLEGYLRTHPELLETLRLPERTQHGLKLLEAVGRPADLAEPRTAWWQSPFLTLGCAVIGAASLLVLWALLARYHALERHLEDTRQSLSQGALVQPAHTRSLTVTPARVPGGAAQIVLNRAQPELLELRIDMAYTAKLNQFQLFIDKQDQGRALVLHNLFKDSNNEIRMTLNSTGLAAGLYNARIEALPFKGNPIVMGFLTLEVR